jgi:serine/threonine protein kinase
MDAYYDANKLRDALFGSILVARSKCDDKKVAIKSLKRSCVDSKTAFDGSGSLQEDALLEIEVMTALKQAGRHPNVMYLHKTFESNDGKLLNMVMDYMPNGELFDKVVEHERLEERTARKYFADCVGGLHHIHKNGFVHRDLSLENCLVNSHDQIVITDFGLAAKYTGKETGRVGKGFYIAPEVFEIEGKGDRRTYDGAKADVWSLGVMLFMMITGVPPTEAPCNEDKRFRLIKAGRIENMLRGWQMDHLFSKSALELVSKMLCTDPTKRISLKEILEHRFVKELPQNTATVTESNGDAVSVDQGDSAWGIEPSTEAPACQNSVSPTKETKNSQDAIDTATCSLLQLSISTIEARCQVVQSNTA